MPGCRDAATPRRERLPWLLSLPLIVSGSMTAHALGSRLFAAHATPADADAGREVAPRADHGLLTVVPVIAGIVLAIGLVYLAVRLGRRSRPGRAERRSGPFLLLPLLAFAIQEMAERVVNAEAILFNPVHEPAFLAGLALQVPFAFLAYVLARTLLRVGVRFARVLGESAPPAPLARASVGMVAVAAVRPSIPVLSLGHSVRGPPLTSAV
jgi:hypothetical protein